MSDTLLERMEAARGGRVVVLTGAGISAASGIPTFRGPEGYWTIGSRVYQPMELATRAAFEQMPRDVWQWYLHRLKVCAAADPNHGHTALARLEDAIGDRFTLVTQNVDGLHLRAGNSRERTLEIHGNIADMRGVQSGSTPRYPVPPSLLDRASDAPLTDEEFALLSTPEGQAARPHVLWFDESYDEVRYRAETAIQKAAQCDVMLIVGTSGATQLPLHCCAVAAQRGATLLDINPEPNPFRRFIEEHHLGAWSDEPAEVLLPQLVERFLEDR